MTVSAEDIAKLAERLHGQIQALSGCDPARAATIEELTFVALGLAVCGLSATALLLAAVGKRQGGDGL